MTVMMMVTTSTVKMMTMTMIMTTAVATKMMMMMMTFILPSTVGKESRTEAGYMSRRRKSRFHGTRAQYSGLIQNGSSALSRLQ